MCGIAGIYIFKACAESIDREELRNIRDHMQERGPDGKGEWYSDDNRVGMAHRRLSIIDLSDSASQPMASVDGSVVISFNGEIYNYRELRVELVKKGYKFKSHSDTEVLINLYQEYGVNMLYKLRGMFAFAIWDTTKKALFLARDQYGIKPLYYSNAGNTFRFASQVKAILAGQRVSKKINSAGKIAFFLFGNVPEPITYYEQIRCVPAGSYLWIEDGKGITVNQQYFSIAKVWSSENNKIISSDKFSNYIHDVLLDSVRHHMIADVPVGAFLSSGIDSCAIVGLMSEINVNAQQLKTITLAFKEYKGSENDESILAAKVAKYYGVDHAVRYVSEEEFQEDLPNILDAMDQPTIDGINTWFVSKAAKERGLKVAVSGLGGDELFGGYPSFIDVRKWVNTFQFLNRIPFLQNVARTIINRYCKLNTNISPKIKGLVNYGGNYAGAYYLKRGLFLPDELGLYLNEDDVVEGFKDFNFIDYIDSILTPIPPNSFAKISTLESSIYMRNQLLRDSDWAGMAHSLEIRIPLVDVKLLENIAPALMKLKKINKKYLLAESPLKEIPDYIAHRSKTGFSTPINSWLKNLNMKSIKTGAFKKLAQHWSRNWALIINEHFENI